MTGAEWLAKYGCEPGKGTYPYWFWRWPVLGRGNDPAVLPGVLWADNGERLSSAFSSRMEAYLVAVECVEAALAKGLLAR